jgi:hypothetical protein
MRYLLALAAAVLLAPGSSLAVEVPVRYLVQEKPLKQQAPAGTMLTFSLWNELECCEDPFACGFPSTPVETGTIAIDDVSILSRVKPLTPKGGAKVPNSVEIQATIDVPSAEGPLYLSVGGAGIVPVGGVCQAQGSPTGNPDPIGLATASLPALAANADYQMVGPVATVRGGQRVSGAVTAQLGRTLVGPTFTYNLCYADLAAFDPPVPFGPGSLTVTAPPSTRFAVTATGSVLLPVSPLVSVGFCVLTGGPLDLNGGLNGSIQPHQREVIPGL